MCEIILVDVRGVNENIFSVGVWCENIFSVGVWCENIFGVVCDVHENIFGVVVGCENIFDVGVWCENIFGVVVWCGCRVCEMRGWWGEGWMIFMECVVGWCAKCGVWGTRRLGVCENIFGVA